MTTTPALTIVDEIVQDLAAGDMSPTHALAELRCRDFTPDRNALDDAVTALRLRDQFLARDGNPYDYLGAEPGQASPNVWDAAIEKAEQDYSWALNVLSRRPGPMRLVAS